MFSRLVDRIIILNPNSVLGDKQGIFSARCAADALSSHEGCKLTLTNVRDGFVNTVTYQRDSPCISSLLGIMSEKFSDFHAIGVL